MFAYFRRASEDRGGGKVGEINYGRREGGGTNATVIVR